jgi:dienelactone hydrolase
MRGLGRTELPAEDRAQLVRLTASVSGLPAPEAERRVTQVLNDARNAASQARKSAVILGFCLAAGLAAAAAAAWIAAGIGGKHRDSEFAPPLRFGGVAVRRV